MAGGGTGKRGIGTRLVGAGRKPEWTGPAVSPPVWRASTYLYENTAAQEADRLPNADGLFHYGARGGPTQWALCDALTELEPGAAGTMLYPTGLAAPVMALLSVLKAGDELLISDNSYDPTRSFATRALKVNAQLIGHYGTDPDGRRRRIRADADTALSDFRRFPAWMWRNRDVLAFVEWLRSRNDIHDSPGAKARFYGPRLRELLGNYVPYEDLGLNVERFRRWRGGYSPHA